jgi:hypothetical protein
MITLATIIFTFFKGQNKFKQFKAEVEKQHDLNTKIVISNHVGEYCGHHTEYGQVPGSFREVPK